jgi:hypothetical protein
MRNNLRGSKCGSKKFGFGGDKKRKRRGNDSVIILNKIRKHKIHHKFISILTPAKKKYIAFVASPEFL